MGQSGFILTHFNSEETLHIQTAEFTSSSLASSSKINLASLDCESDMLSSIALTGFL